MTYFGSIGSEYGELRPGYVAHQPKRVATVESEEMLLVTGVLFSPGTIATHGLRVCRHAVAAVAQDASGFQAVFMAHGNPEQSHQTTAGLTRAVGILAERGYAMSSITAVGPAANGESFDRQIVQGLYNVADATNAGLNVCYYTDEQVSGWPGVELSVVFYAQDGHRTSSVVVERGQSRQVF